MNKYQIIVISDGDDAGTTHATESYDGDIPPAIFSRLAPKAGPAAVGNAVYHYLFGRLCPSLDDWLDSGSDIGATFFPMTFVIGRFFNRHSKLGGFLCWL